MMDGSPTARERSASSGGALPFGAVHQFHPACASGDGITSGLFLTQKFLRNLGYESEIFCEHISPELASVVLHHSKREDRPGDVLLFHHSLGYRNIQWLKNVSALRVLVYHNITPDFLLPDGELRELSRLGRNQLQELRRLFEASVGDSEENAAELRALGYRDVRVLPLLVDLDRYATLKPNPAVMASLQDSVNILFVGRVAENKRQSDIVDSFNLYFRHFEPRARLQLVGGCTSAGYLAQIRRKVHDLELDDVVALPGKVSDEDLTAHYQVADVYLSLSEHEGFGMPLVEAMALGVPVVAHASASIPWTVGPGGLLLQTRDPEYVAATLDQVVSNPALRRAMRRGARRSLGRFAPAVLEHELAELLQALGGRPERPHEVSTAPGGAAWRVEGPMDLSTGLAVSHRNLALALSASGVRTAANPALRELAERGGETPGEDVTLRSSDPPRTEGMLGLVRLIHSFGWEETGFPQRYVDWFNQRLDLVTVLSTAVKKVLMDSGVKVPIAVVGAGTDHLPGAIGGPRAEGRPFRFLHVSSCFSGKGPDVLLEAWRRSFSAADPVCLVIKTSPSPRHSMEADLATFRTKYPGAAPVELLNEGMGDERIAGLYQSADAFVSAARGEEYGQSLAAAMRHGLPVITTNWGGQTDFCDDQTAWMVDCSFDHSRSQLVEGLSLWVEPCVQHLSDRLREVFTASNATRRVRTDKARERILADSSWARVAQRTRAAVNGLSSLPQFSPELQIGLLTTWNSRCGVAEYARTLVEELRGPILANRTADLIGEDSERVVRCWDCGAPAEALGDVFEQVVARGLDAVVIQYNPGFFPLAVLAEFITRLRRQGIAVYCIIHSTTEITNKDTRDVPDALSGATRLFVRSVTDLNRLKECGLASNSSMLVHEKAVASRLRNVIESCTVDQRFERAMQLDR